MTGSIARRCAFRRHGGSATMDFLKVELTE